MTGPPAPSGVMPGHRNALEQLRRVAGESGGTIQVVHAAGRPDRSGRLAVELSLDCSRVPRRPSGLPLEARERVIVKVPAAFPFDTPRVWVPHSRFAGAPHVQWVNVRVGPDQQGNEICLYQAPSVEWSPGDGMLGLLERLLQWYKRAAAGTLDAPGQPMHPPVAYPTPGAGCVVVRANAPRVAGDAPRPLLALALLRWVAPWRTDVVGWLDGDDPLGQLWPTGEAEALALPGRLRSLAGVGGTEERVFLGLAFVLPRPTVFELPEKMRDLVAALGHQGLEAAELIGRMALTARLNTLVPGDTGVPLYVLVGSPARGPADHERITHLNAWLLHELDAAALSYLSFEGSQVPELAAIARKVAAEANDWLEQGDVAWAYVYEQRPELIARRDIESPAGWLRGRKVLVIGCGALGAPIAEQCVRGGVAELTLVDKGAVNPGVLVRQPYLDDEVGLAKAEVLAERLRRVRPGVTITAKAADAVDTVLRDGAGIPRFDLVVDATANLTVAAKLERDRWPNRDRWPPVASVAIGHKAERGVATLSLPGATGAGVDILRRLGLVARADPEGRLADVVDDLFPRPPRTELFHPEPGCSEPTFVGSASQVAALASQLFNAVLDGLAGAAADRSAARPMAAHVARLSTEAAATPPLVWADDLVLRDPTTRYEVRIAPPALAAMQAECGDADRRHGPLVETGGRLLGQVDDACRIVWVSSATGPPPDSERSSLRFRLGVAGVPELLAGYDAASGGLARLVGEWHTHPGGPTAESTTDHEAMATLLTASGPVLAQELLLILGGPPSRWTAWVERGEPPELYVRLARRYG